MKKLLICSLVLLSSSCADFQQTVDARIKEVNAALNTKSPSSGQTTASAKKPGTLTNEQCKTSVGKTKAYFEQILGFKLNESNSSGYTSFSESYNLKISDRKDRFGGDLAICILSIDPQTSKVTTFAMPT
ncbi:hypothetical protein [Erwinia rhapontici]|uniref:hypothetical protein n=1 Tax=Erwinia rhapontici TaxID=55212 RepID=UPI002169E976|nr:hypothetical protein [Erwinia rhapontici]MCS3606255.1 hypothetical protein [Erwinia rhapontici]